VESEFAHGSFLSFALGVPRPAPGSTPERATPKGCRDRHSRRPFFSTSFAPATCSRRQHPAYFTCSREPHDGAVSIADLLSAVHSASRDQLRVRVVTGRDGHPAPFELAAERGQGSPARARTHPDGRELAVEKLRGDRRRCAGVDVRSEPPPLPSGVTVDDDHLAGPPAEPRTRTRRISWRSTGRGSRRREATEQRFEQIARTR